MSHAAQTPPPPKRPSPSRQALKGRFLVSACLVLLRNENGRTAEQIVRKAEDVYEEILRRSANVGE